VAQSGDRRQSNEEVYSVMDKIFIVGKSPEHLGCALGVTSISNLLHTSMLSDIVNLSRQVILSKFGKAEVEKFFLVGFWVKSLVYS